MTETLFSYLSHDCMRVTSLSSGKRDMGSYNYLHVQGDNSRVGKIRIGHESIVNLHTIFQYISNCRERIGFLASNYARENLKKGPSE